MRLDSFVGPSYVSQSPYADCEDLFNWYVEEIESQGRTTRSAFYPTPGVEEITSGAIPTGTGRAHYFENGRQFLVLGKLLYEMSQDGILTERLVTGEPFGALEINSFPATISGNGTGGGQLFITSGQCGYVYDLSTNVLTKIAALDGISTMGDFLEGYFFSLDVNTGIVRISDLNDGSTWDPTQFIQNSASSDDWISMKVANRYLYLMGKNTTQAWFNAGTFPIPVEPHPSGLMQYGVGAIFSPEVVGNSLIWLSATINGRGSVIRTSGFTPEIISNFALHNAFDSYALLSDAIGDSYEDAGHLFYILTFQTANVTWAWDSSSGWAKRGTWNSGRNAYDLWRPCFHAFAFGEHRILDIRGTGIYRMSKNYYYDVEGILIRRVRRSPAIVDENNLVFYSKFELDLQPGLADLSGQGSAPVVMLRTSKDNGMTWGNEMEASAGLRGEYQTRVEWNRLGAARRMVFEVSVTDPIPWRVLGAFVDMKRSIKGQQNAA